MQQALDALDNHNGNYALTKQECADINKVCDNLRQELAKPEQEPVAWKYESEASFDGDKWLTNYGYTGSQSLAKFNSGTIKNPQPLYAVPPRKEWVSLSDEKRHAVTQSPFTEENYRAIENALKELNE